MDKPIDLAKIKDPLDDFGVRAKLFEIDPTKKYLLFIETGEWLSRRAVEEIRESLAVAIERIGVHRVNVAIFVMQGVRAKMVELDHE